MYCTGLDVNTSPQTLSEDSLPPPNATEVPINKPPYTKVFSEKMR